MDNGSVLNAQQAAEFLGAHVETIRRLARKGAVPAYKIGKDWRFRKDALTEWAQSNPNIKRRSTILVVDDDAGVIKLIRRHLESDGYRVIGVARAREGLRQIQSKTIDLVLLDLLMPEMTGPEFIREVKQYHPALPIIIVTGYPDGPLMAEAYRLGPLMLIPKPIDKESLISAVKITLVGSLSENVTG